MVRIKDIAIINYYKKINRYSFNVLIGSLEIDNYFDDIDVYFIDNDDEIINLVRKITDKYKNVVIAYSFSSPQIWEIYSSIIKLKKELKTDVLFIAGGPHPTGDPIGTLKMGFNYVVRGEGEVTFNKFIKYWCIYDIF